MGSKKQVIKEELNNTNCTIWIILLEKILLD